MRKKLYSLLAAVTLLLLLSGCGETSANLYCRADALDPYGPLAAQTLEGYGAKTQGKKPFVDFHGHNVLECLDVQALPAIREGVGNYWYPQCLATAVICLDRDQTDARITGWKDLLESDLKTSWNGDHTFFQLLFGAVSYGLEGPDFTGDPVLSLWRRQYADGRFVRNTWETPAMVCLDFQAVAQMRQGRNLEILVPEEGTLSFALGLLSYDTLEPPTDEALLSAGLRLLDERCTDRGYPHWKEYGGAVRLQDYSDFLEKTGDLLPDLRRGVYRTWLYSSADPQEQVIFALLAVILCMVWLQFSMYRSVRPDVKRAVQWHAGLLMGWVLMRLLRYQLDPLCTLSRYCWYSYAVFQMALPLVMLYITSTFEGPEDRPRYMQFLRYYNLLYPVLCVLVMTNDFHGWVQTFDPENWMETVEFHWGSLAIYLYTMVSFCLSEILLVKKSWQSKKNLAWMLPALLGVFLFCYSSAYFLGVPLARNSDFAMTFGFFALGFFETALWSGLIPTNSRYGMLFEASPLNMQLLDRQGKTVLASGSAANLSPVQRVQLQSAPSVCIHQDGDTLLYAHAISGGTVVWQENIAPLNRLHRDLEASVQRTEAANALLRQEEEIRRQKLAADVKARLFSSLEREIETKTQALSKAIQDLPAASDREQQTAYITLLLCHIKRRCNLFFLAQEGKTMVGDELAMYLDELSEFAGFAGVRALVRSGNLGDLEVRMATLCYDYYFSMLSWAMDSGATLVGQLTDGERGLEFRLLSSESVDKQPFSPEFFQAVADCGGHVVCKNLEDTSGITLAFSKEGGA